VAFLWVVKRNRYQARLSEALRREMFRPEVHFWKVGAVRQTACKPGQVSRERDYSSKVAQRRSISGRSMRKPCGV
jgi:hypothetical protein